MSKVRVSLHQQPNKFAVLDAAATVGATVGVNLFLPDGSVVTMDMLSGQAAAPATGSQQVSNLTVWSRLLEVPQNVRAVENMAGEGVVVRSGTNLVTKTLIEGPNVTITETAGSITIEAVGGGTVGFEIDGGIATTTYAGEPAFDFGSAT